MVPARQPINPIISITLSGLIVSFCFLFISHSFQTPPPGAISCLSSISTTKCSIDRVTTGLDRETVIRLTGDHVNIHMLPARSFSEPARISFCSCQPIHLSVKAWPFSQSGHSDISFAPDKPLFQNQTH